jgi:hypothetical protein
MNDILILLTKSQVENLMDFFEMSFIPMIRDVDEIDDMMYLVDMCEIYKEIKRQYDNAKGRGISLEQCVPADDIIDIKEGEEKCDG